MNTQQAQLRDALVGATEDRLRLYHESVEFHAGIDMLASVLPMFLDSLATHAEAVEVNRKLLIDQMNNGGAFDASLLDPKWEQR